MKCAAYNLRISVFVEIRIKVQEQNTWDKNKGK
jgi:hypothetical protein